MLVKKKHKKAHVLFKSNPTRPVFNNFLKKNWCTQVLFVVPLIPLFWTSGDVCPEFQSQGGSLAFVLSHLCDPQIHLWCDTS